MKERRAILSKLARLADAQAGLAAEQAAAMRELAQLEGGGDDERAVPAPPRPPRPARPRRKRMVEPACEPGPVTSLGREKARMALRRQGVPLAEDEGTR